MFQITRRADYAVRMLLALAAQPEGSRVPTSGLAPQTGVPRAFLHKITADLVRAGLVRTTPGPAGGLALARPASEIHLQHILEAIEGPIYLNVCLVRPHECPRDQTCPAHPFWARLQAGLVAELRAATLARLLAEAEAAPRGPASVLSLDQSPLYPRGEN